MKMLMMCAAPVVAALMFQQPVTPPMKMGLWETTSTTTMSGMEGMPAGMPGMGPRTVKVRSCVTPETFQQSFASQNKSCTRSNEVSGPKSFSYDLTCGHSTGHFTMKFDNDETGHFTSHMVTGGGGHSMTLDGTGTGTFISSSCGAVTPDKPQIVK